MKYNTQEKEKKAFLIVMITFLIIMAVAAVLQICGVFDEPAWKPVATYPMANQHIEWTWAGRS